jgi:hypothetical protein
VLEKVRGVPMTCGRARAGQMLGEPARLREDARLEEK